MDINAIITPALWRSTRTFKCRMVHNDARGTQEEPAVRRLQRVNEAGAAARVWRETQRISQAVHVTELEAVLVHNHRDGGIEARKQLAENRDEIVLKIVCRKPYKPT